MLVKSNYKLGQRALSFLILMVFVAGSVMPAMAQRRRTSRAPRISRASRTSLPPAPRRHVVAADTIIRVRMNEKISSGSSRVGDRFTTTVVDPVYANGIEVIPAGSTVNGRVTTIDRASRKSQSGSMGVKFVSVETPNGSSYAINGSLTSLSSNDVNADNEGGVSGRSATKRNVVFIGGGAATGALIGAIAGGGKGAGIGSAVGAGLGVAGAIFAKGKEAEVEPGTEFGVILNQSVSIFAANVR